MNGFERAGVALMYYLYYVERMFETGKEVRGKFFTVENRGKMTTLSREFKVIEASPNGFNLELQSENKKIQTEGTIKNHEFRLRTINDRPYVEINVKKFNSEKAEAYVRPTEKKCELKPYSSNQIHTRDDEYGSEHIYTIRG